MDKTEDIAASFFDQQQCSMVVVENKGCHHVCTTSAGEHKFLEFTFQGLEHTTEIPNLALESVQACAFKRPARQSSWQKASCQGKEWCQQQITWPQEEPSPAEIAPDHQLEEIVSASPSRMFPRLTNWSITRLPKAANMLHWG